VTGPAEGHPALRLVPLELEHLDHVMTWVNDHEVLAYFAGRQTDIGVSEERRYLEGLIASPDDRVFSVFDGEAYVGQCSVNQIYWPARNGRLFLVIRRELQGRGYGSSALRRLVDLAFTELDLHKLWLIVRRDNRDAQSLYLRLGFDFEGVLRDEYRVKDRYHDMVRMSRMAPG
jgi:diamine N-acetyltransferase